MEICSVCQKHKEESQEVPGWCVDCASKYGEYVDIPRTEKIRHKRREREYCAD